MRFKLFLFYLCCLFCSVIAKAQVTLSLTYTEKNGVTTLPAGDYYTMQLNYSVSSTTGDATGVKIEIPMPDYVYNVSNFVGTTHAPIGNFVYNNTLGAKSLTINFISPLASGSNGVLEFRIVSANLTTPNNTVLTTTATMTATGGFTSGPQTNNMTLTAIPRICAQKVLLNGGALGHNTTYRIYVRTAEGPYHNAPNGTLQATNITLMDNLPAGATFVSANVYTLMANTFVGTGTESGGVVTVPIPDLSFWTYTSGPAPWQATGYYADITVRFDSPTFSVGNTVDNTATVQYTLYGQPEYIN